MNKKFYICNGVYDLRCFLEIVRGNSCYHSKPHEPRKDCESEACTLNPDRYYLRGCSCNEIKEEKYGG